MVMDTTPAGSRFAVLQGVEFTVTQEDSIQYSSNSSTSTLTKPKATRQQCGPLRTVLPSLMANLLEVPSFP